MFLRCQHNSIRSVVKNFAGGWHLSKTDDEFVYVGTGEAVIAGQDIG